MLEKNVQIQVKSIEQSREIQAMVLDNDGMWLNGTKGFLCLDENPMWLPPYYISIYVGAPHSKDGVLRMGIQRIPTLTGSPMIVDMSYLRNKISGETEGLFSRNVKT